MKHFKTKHSITEVTAKAASNRPRSQSQLPHRGPQDHCSLLEEEEPPLDSNELHPPKKMRQLGLSAFVERKHTLRSDAVKMLCRTTITMNEMVTEEVIRRLFTRAYPGDRALPKSGSTLTKWLREDATDLRYQLRVRLH